MSAGGVGDVKPCEAAFVVTDGHCEQGVHIFACYVIALGILDFLGSGALHLEVHSINGTHLPTPEVTPCSCSEVCLQLRESSRIVDGEMHIVEVGVDGVHYRQPVP